MCRITKCEYFFSHAGASQNAKQDMNRRFVTLVILLLLTKLAYPQLRYESRNKETINKKVKEIKIWRYNLQSDTAGIANPTLKQTVFKIDTIKFGSRIIIDTSIITTGSVKSTALSLPDSIMWTHNKYNKKGLLVSQDGYFMHIDYNKYLHKYFFYDNKNRLTKQIETNKDSTSSEIYECIFDDKNKSIRLNQTFNLRLKEYTIWNYGKRGELISKTNYWGDGRIQDARTYEYSNNNRVIKSVNTEPYGGFIVFKLNKRHYIIESSFWENDSFPIQVNVNTYSSFGKIIQERIYAQNGDVKETINYEYDSNNNLLVIYAIDAAKKKRLKEERRYSNNLLKHIIYYDKDGMPIRKMLYEYKLW